MHRLPYSVRKPLFDGLGIDFSPEQLEVIKHDDRFPVVGGGERGGKTFVIAADAVPHIVMLPQVNRADFYNPDGSLKFDENVDKPRSPHVLLLGPTYAEPREEFKLIEMWLAQLGLIAGGVNKPSKPQEGPWRLITKHGVVIQTWSLEDPSSLRAVNIEFALVCEAGRCPYTGVERVQGRVSGTRGFILYSGTMEDSQQWYQDWMLIGKRDNYLDIKSYSLPAYTNRHMFPGGLFDKEIQRLKRVYPEDVFAMRVLAEPRPPRARVIKEAQPEHIRRVKSIPADADLEIWIDPGYSSAYAVIWVAHWLETDKKTQEKFRRFHIFDELYEQGLVTADIVALCKKMKHWKKVTEAVIDIAGKGHRDAGGESALEIWKKLTPLKWNMKYWHENPLIERVRTSFKSGSITIDPKCAGLIAELGLGEPVFDNMHPWKYLINRDGKIDSERPVDKWNHSCKALGYGLLHHLGQVERVNTSKPISRMQKRNIRGRVVVTREKAA